MSVMSVENHLDKGGGSQRSPKAGLESKHAHSGKEMNILVLGKHGVGKTALIVRYLTKRFIGDYNSDKEMLYSHATSIDGKHLTLHIIDTQGQRSLDDVSPSQVLWADCVIIVFAVNSKTSFDLAQSIVEHVHHIRAENQMPVGLVANKSDMIDRKQVSDTEISRLCAEFNHFFFETAASEARTSVADVFETLAQQVRIIFKKKEKLTRFMANPAVAARLQIQQSFRSLAERTWRSRTSTL
ncbi:ras-like protein family member 11A-like [Mya arenaria]|uniref:ras-like protein family member 11A-like n=1 Tax=Mya arenaria TaxID=6604 RepID=UPI0022E05CCE|nr:ras-like protein family member 11A-like [Mya arenaria]